MADHLKELSEASRSGRPYTLLISDGHMPEMDGFSLVEQVRRDARMTPLSIIMLTSAGRSDDLERCRRLGIAAHLIKPVKQSDLFDTIADAVDRDRRGASSAAAGSPGERLHRASKDEESTADARSLRALHVLLVEDNAVNREVATALLEKQGHRVTAAVNGQEALDALDGIDADNANGGAKGGFDIVLMDVQMPVMGGYEATAAIRSKEKATGRHIPILAMTAHAMEGDRERCLAAGMDGYIAKPIRQELLRDAMMEVLEPAAGSAPSASNPQTPAIPDPPAARTPVLDRTTLMTRMGNDIALVRKIARLFVEDCPGMLARIRQAIARGDAEALRSEAHTLKGSAANFVAPATVAAAARLEAQGRSGDLDGAKAASDVLARELRRLVTALGALGVGSPRRTKRDARGAKPKARRAVKKTVRKTVKKPVKKTGTKTLKKTAKKRAGPKPSAPGRKRTNRARSKSGAARSRRRNR